MIYWNYIYSPFNIAFNHFPTCNAIIQRYRRRISLTHVWRILLIATATAPPSCRASRSSSESFYLPIHCPIFIFVCASLPFSWNIKNIHVSKVPNWGASSYARATIMWWCCAAPYVLPILPVAAFPLLHYTHHSSEIITHRRPKQQFYDEPESRPSRALLQPTTSPHPPDQRIAGQRCSIRKTSASDSWWTRTE